MVDVLKGHPLRTPVAPMVPSTRLPETITIGGQNIPVNWVRLSWYEVELPKADTEREMLRRITAGEEVGEIPEMPETEIREIWAPVLPPQFATPENMSAIYGFLHSTPEGEDTYTLMNPDEVTGAGLDWEDFIRVSSYFSLASDIVTKGVPEVLELPDVKDYLTQQAKLMAGGEPLDYKGFYQELSKIQLYPEYADKLRMLGEMAGVVPPYAEAKDIQRGEALQGLFEKTAEHPFYRTEEERLEHYIEELGPLAEEFGEKIRAGVVDPLKLMGQVEQKGVAAYQIVEGKKKRLAEIRTAQAVSPVLEQVTAGDIEVSPEARAKMEEAATKKGKTFEKEYGAQEREERRRRKAEAARKQAEWERLQARAWPQRRTFI